MSNRVDDKLLSIEHRIFDVRIRIRLLGRHGSLWSYIALSWLVPLCTIALCLHRYASWKVLNARSGY